MVVMPRCAPVLDCLAPMRAADLMRRRERKRRGDGSEGETYGAGLPPCNPISHYNFSLVATTTERVGGVGGGGSSVDFCLYVLGEALGNGNAGTEGKGSHLRCELCDVRGRTVEIAKKLAPPSDT